jgi:hypothetical protein
VEWSWHTPIIYSACCQPHPLPARSPSLWLARIAATQWFADFTIVQNGSTAGPDDFFIPSWSQPGLIPRDPGRGTNVEEVAYVGPSRSSTPS